MNIDSIRHCRMYADLAYLWPLVSRPDDYAVEASFWRRTLRNKLGPGRHHLLDLGVGGGHNLSHLTAEFDATAVDISVGMLELSKRLNPQVEHVVGDMRSVRMGRKFRAVLIHDAVNYMLSEKDLHDCFVTAAEHLDVGGVLVTGPDYVKENFEDNILRHSTRSDGERTLTYVEYQYDPDSEDTTYDNVMLYFIRQEGKLRVEEDFYRLGLFPLKTWTKAMEKAGFAVELHEYDFEEDRRQSYLIVGVRR